MSGQHLVGFFDNEAHAGHLVGEAEWGLYVPISPYFMRLLASSETPTSRIQVLASIPFYGFAAIWGEGIGGQRPNPTVNHHFAALNRHQPGWSKFTRTNH